MAGRVGLAGSAAYLGVADATSASPRPGALDAYAPGAAYAPDGTLIALVTEESGQARPVVVFA